MIKSSKIITFKRIIYKLLGKFIIKNYSKFFHINFNRKVKQLISNKIIIEKIFLNVKCYIELLTWKTLNSSNHRNRRSNKIQSFRLLQFPNISLEFTLILK